MDRGIGKRRGPISTCLFPAPNPIPLAPYLLVARGFKSEIAIRHGIAAGGVEGLRSSLQKLHAAPYELLTAELNLSLVGGLSAVGRIEEAIALIDETLAGAETNGDLLHSPELLR